MGRTVIAGSTLAILVSILGCSGNESCPAVCERSTLTSRLVSGQVTFATGDESPQTRTLVYDEFGSGGPDACSVGYLRAEVFRSEFVNAVGPSVHCNLDAGYLSVNLHAVGDPRSLAVGRHALAPARERGFVEVRRSTCLSRGADGLFAVDVANATGEAAPYPMLVTGDYARDFTMHVEAVADTIVAGTACAPTSVVLDLSLTQTASDAVFDAMARCPCE